MINNLNNINDVNNDNIANNNNNTIIGYMNSVTGPRNSIPVLVFIEIPKNTTTDLFRADIIDPLNATYITNKFKIIKIIDENLNEYSVCKIDGQIFEKNNEVDENDIFYSFYLSKKRAIYLTRDYNCTGHILDYYDNGQIEYEYTLNEKKRKCGKFMHWNLDTTLFVESNYSNGKLDGEYKKYEEGKLIKHVKYSNGKLIEYLNQELAKNKIDKIYNKAIKQFNIKKTNVNFDLMYTKNIKHNFKIIRYVKNENFVNIIDMLENTVADLTTIKIINNEVNVYNNLKKIDIIKKMYDTINTNYGRSYYKVFSKTKEDKLLELDEFIQQFSEKIEPEYQEFKLYLANIKNTLFT